MFGLENDRDGARRGVFNTPARRVRNAVLYMNVRHRPRDKGRHSSIDLKGLKPQ